jgi:hypothetical protein
MLNLILYPPYLRNNNGHPGGKSGRAEWCKAYSHKNGEDIERNWNNKTEKRGELTMEKRSKCCSQNIKNVGFEMEVGRHKVGNFSMTTLKFIDKYNTSLYITINDNEQILEANESMEEIESLRIDFCGDDQSEMLIEALEFAVRSLKELNQSIVNGSI